MLNVSQTSMSAQMQSILVQAFASTHQEVLAVRVHMGPLVMVEKMAKVALQIKNFQ